MRMNPVTKQARPRPTRNARLHVAPCWSTQQVSDLGGSEREQFAILVFGKELDLADGLRQMKDKGWQVLEVQRNRDRHRSRLPAWVQPDFYYLFERSKDHKAPDTGKPAQRRRRRTERNQEGDMGKGH